MARTVRGPGATVRRRRLLLAGAVGTAVLGMGLTASAEGGMTVTPSSGYPGSGYEVTVECGDAPLIYPANTQDASVQGTIGPTPSEDLTEVSPSLWVLGATAGTTDDEYWATCGEADAAAGTGYFDAYAPHLWFGPRPQYIGDDRDPRTTVEGTDCKAGTTASVTINAGDIVLTSEEPIDEHGDWSVPLPSPVGTEDITVDASCGEIRYTALTATSTTTSTVTVAPTEPPVTVAATVPAAPGAAAQPGTASYTG